MEFNELFHLFNRQKLDINLLRLWFAYQIREMRRMEVKKVGILDPVVFNYGDISLEPENDHSRTVASKYLVACLEKYADHDFILFFFNLEALKRTARGILLVPHIVVRREAEGWGVRWRFCSSPATWGRGRFCSPAARRTARRRGRAWRAGPQGDRWHRVRLRLETTAVGARLFSDLQALAGNLSTSLDEEERSNCLHSILLTSSAATILGEGYRQSSSSRRRRSLRARAPSCGLFLFFVLLFR
ncbi:hypothetical protein BRADI_1g42591v3 [Brachypodium distachyon]|uniref:Uncharacterized protein n=1 Tax=Brachypodium distachyon TaxID=15368 RepID=A0A2K2DNY1_BRADI|nr:hypothetical protein BRADI_1g42591v3 [Brachypodium distachyon]